jgi:O-antigen/teichoic acid export membrane protein
MSLLISPLTQVVEQYTKWQPAIISFILFALSIGWAAISTPLVNALNAIGQINKTLKLMIIWTTLTWVITPIAMLLYGFNGVGIAALVVSFSSVLSIKFVKKYIAVNIWDQVWRQLLAAVGMVIVGLFLQSVASQSISRLLFTATIMGLSYLIALIIFGHDKLIKEIKSLKS